MTEPRHKDLTIGEIDQLIKSKTSQLEKTMGEKELEHHLRTDSTARRRSRLR